MASTFSAAPGGHRDPAPLWRSAALNRYILDALTPDAPARQAGNGCGMYRTYYDLSSVAPKYNYECRPGQTAIAEPRASPRPCHASHTVKLATSLECDDKKREPVFVENCASTNTWSMMAFQRNINVLQVVKVRQSDNDWR